MATSTGAGDSFKDILQSSVRSASFWSYIAGVVGIIAVAAGGIIFLATDELRDFSVGVLVIGFALLFLALVLSPRSVAMFLVGRRGRYGANVAVMAVAFLAIVVLVNFLMFRNPNRIDVTATRVFTLAPQTVQVLETLDSPVRANAFFAPSGRGTAFARQQTEDLLNELARLSDRFTYRFIDPELNRSLAVRYDVKDYPSIVFEDVVEGRLQTVNTFTEQHFVTGILIATGEQQKKIYFLTGHGEASVTRDFTSGDIDPEGLDFALEGMLRDNYSVQPLNLIQVKQVPEDAAVLIIAGPKQTVSKQQREAIGEYLKGGGRLVALFDPDTPDTFLELLSPWGVTLGRQSIADAVSNVAGEMLTPLLQKTNGQYFTSGQTGVAVADEIDVTFFPQVTSVELAVPPDDLPGHIGFIPLAATTPASWLEENVENVNFVPGEDTRGPFTVAAVVTALGTLDQPSELALGPLVKLVVFGDSDFAKNRFFFSSDNADFLLNSVNWLADDYELISIRPKLAPFRQLVVNTQERSFIRWSSWFLPPTLMLLAGVFVWWRRR